MEILKRFMGRFMTPFRMLASSFGLLIILGSLGLYLPVMQGEQPISFLDCLFTATSAVCVTGLITVDTATAWSPWGQALILLLIQIGGLGIMTYGVALLYLSGQKPSPKTHRTLSKAFGSVPGQQVHSLAKDVVIYTLCLEFLGTLLLWVRFGQDYAWPKALALAGFHCVSAFCNAGFSLFSNSLVDYAHDPLVNSVILFLIVAGGIGFLVMRELVTRWRTRKSVRPKRLSLNTRLVLFSSLGLFVLGALVLALFEFMANGGEAWQEGIWPVVFTSLTPRTAGFNTIEMSDLSNASILVVMFLMLIGASPGSCGGGVKTTTFAVLVLLVKNRVQGKNWAGMCGRAVSDSQLANALALVMCSLVVVFVGSLILVSLELNQSPLAEARGETLVLAFEAVSAFGTVGLSLGATGHLNWAGKLVVIALMFIGRIGPLTFVYSLSKRVAVRSFSLAEERIMIG